MIYDILPVNNYQGNDSTTTFDFDFYIDNQKQLKVSLFDENAVKIELQNNVDYSINQIGNKNGSYITFPIPGSSYGVLKQTQKISLELVLSAEQVTQYNNSSLLNLSALESSFDYLTRLIQILKRKISLCVKVEECSNNTPQELMDNLNVSAFQATKSAADAEALKNEIVLLKNDVLSAYEKTLTIKNDIDKTQDVINSVHNKADIDLSNSEPTSNFKVQSISWVMPDYTAGVTKSNDVDYIAEVAGLLVASDSGNNNCFVYINGVNVGTTGGSATNVIYNNEFFVDKGDVYKLTNWNKITFYPLKGAN